MCHSYAVTSDLTKIYQSFLDKSRRPKAPQGSQFTLKASICRISAKCCKFSTAGDAAGPLDGPTADDLKRREAAMSGDDSAPATYLAKVAQNKSDVAGLRPEMYTIYKEEEMKARGVEMITRDRTYDPQKEQSGAYKPKVSTWGVFPRPADISKAYGGGKTIQPGDVRPLCTGLHHTDHPECGLMACYKGNCRVSC